MILLDNGFVPSSKMGSKEWKTQPTPRLPVRLLGEKIHAALPVLTWQRNHIFGSSEKKIGMTGGRRLGRTFLKKLQSGVQAPGHQKRLIAGGAEGLIRPLVGFQLTCEMDPQGDGGVGSPKERRTYNFWGKIQRG